MQKITFVNNQEPALNATNLNQLQTNVENAIEEKSTYSTTETKIGTWINGKNIYRKVITFNPRTDVLQTSYSHNISNIDEILPTSSCLLHRTSENFVPLSMVYPDNSTNILAWSCGWQATKNTIITWIGTNMREQIDTTTYGIVAVLEYTKTTN